MKKSLYILVLTAIPTLIFLFGGRHVNAPHVPADLRDAPVSKSTLSQVSDMSLQPLPVPEASPAAMGVTPVPVQAAAKEWTVMVFVNGKNNLENAGLNNINSMEEVGSTDKVNVVVEFGRMSGQLNDSHEDGDWTGVRRYVIAKDSDPHKITSPVLLDLGQVDMGEPQAAVDFVNWSKRNFPARKYLFILWNHGGGWMFGISQDEENGSIINAKKIGDVLRQSGGVDVLAFDACLMQMAEVAYEVKNTAKVVVGSEETIPEEGYPYAAFLSDLIRNPSIGPETLGSTIVADYGKFYTSKIHWQNNKYNTSATGVTLSAIRTSQLPELAARTRDFARLVMASNDKNAMVIAKKDSTRYGAIGHDMLYIKSPYVDLYSFVNNFSGQVNIKSNKYEDIRKSGADLKAFISKSLVINNVALGTDKLGASLKDSHGISIYMPPTNPAMTRDKIDRLANTSYEYFEFNGETRWLDFVLFMYKIELMEGRDLPMSNDGIYI